MAWLTGGYDHRFKVTSQNAQVDEAIDNVYFALSDAPAGFWQAGGVNSTDGRDIRVTRADGTTEVARELAGFDHGNTLGALVVKATGLATGSDIDF